MTRPGFRRFHAARVVRTDADNLWNAVDQDGREAFDTPTHDEQAARQLANRLNDAQIPLPSPEARTPKPSKPGREDAAPVVEPARTAMEIQKAAKVRVLHTEALGTAAARLERAQDSFANLLNQEWPELKGYLRDYANHRGAPRGRILDLITEVEGSQMAWRRAGTTYRDVLTAQVSR